MYLSCGKPYIAILMPLKEGKKASRSHWKLMKSHMMVILFKNLDLIEDHFHSLEKELCFKMWTLIAQHLKFY